MKEIDILEAKEVNGGSWETFVDGACIAYTSAVVFSIIPAKLAGDVACVGWAIYRSF